MTKSKLIRIILILLLVLWITVIFVMSSQPAAESSKTSSKFVIKIIDVIYRDFENFSAKRQANITNIITLLVRKSAHFLEYFILGLLSAGVATTYKDKKHSLNFVWAALFCVVYAISDELHQYFVPGRACRLLDVCIDSMGSIFAVAFIALLTFAIRYKTGETNAQKEIN